jgi:hypothetical protein
MEAKTEVNPSDVDSSNMHDSEKQVALQHEERMFEIATGALPHGYFKSMNFIGTMFAAQSAWAAVSVHLIFAI